MKRQPAFGADVLVAVGIIGALSGGAAAAVTWVLPGPPSVATVLVCLMTFAAVLMLGIVASEPIIRRATQRRLRRDRHR
ncbi:hypothetical protein [Kitasatospora aureofaciens]|uniref:hypothetical protein n=1 Tax=Kitasatospora aureofaciens TaxID=1894 RepID=UPI001C455A35|nr:hypothetical protein [Kitasatospora aureofaciens]MBV6698520.1 hypothetical protein [Kitasatospora aureofaciens]